MGEKSGQTETHTVDDLEPHRSSPPLSFECLCDIAQHFPGFLELSTKSNFNSE